MMGTLGYAPLEQMGGDGAVGPAADVHALGVMLFEMLCGELPWTGESWVELLARQAREEARRLPGGLGTIAARGLAREPAERHPDAGAFARDLQDWLERRPVAGHRYTRRERLALLAARRPGRVAAAGVLAAGVLALALAGGLWWRGVRQAERAALADEQAGYREALERTLLRLGPARAELDAARGAATAALGRYARPYLEVYQRPGELGGKGDPDPGTACARQFERLELARRALLTVHRELAADRERLTRRGGSLRPAAKSALAGEAADRRAATAALLDWETASSGLALAATGAADWSAVHRLREQHGPHPAADRVLAARRTLVVGPLPEGATARLVRVLKRSPLYGEQDLGKVPPAGLPARELAAGSYLLRVRHAGREWILPLVLERPRHPALLAPPPGRLEPRALLAAKAPVHALLPPLVFVPRGISFAGGAAGGDPWPRHRRFLREGAWLAAHETTVAEYRRFLAALPVAERAPMMPAILADNRWTPLYDDQLQPRFGLSDRHPLSGVSHQQALAYCAWLSKATGLVVRLPSETLWLRAARGADGRRYPWGEADPTGRACVKVGRADPRRIQGRYWSPAGAFPADRSVFGALDLCGNVSEWTADPWHAFESGKLHADLRMARGGSWGSSGDLVFLGARYRVGPTVRNPNLGFRVCVRAPRSR